MTWRSAVRGSLPYAIAIVGGFLLAYLIVAFVVFPSGVVPGEARVPDVAGLTYDEAGRRLAARGFRTQRGETRFHAAAPLETVLEQYPSAGTQDVEGSSVILHVSGGPRMVPVPNVVGLTREQAEAALELAGFELAPPVLEPSDRPFGRVMATRPPAGSRVAAASPVTLVVSTGPGPDQGFQQ